MCSLCGAGVGMVELITGSETLRKIQALSGITGSFKERTIKDWLQKHNPTELQYNKVLLFIVSCPFYTHNDPFVVRCPRLHVGRL